MFSAADGFSVVLPGNTGVLDGRGACCCIARFQAGYFAKALMDLGLRNQCCAFQEIEIATLIGLADVLDKQFSVPA
jgi:hypothetical protein